MASVAYFLHRAARFAHTTVATLCVAEIVRVELPGEYKKEAWSMAEDEKRAAVPTLREEGNVLYKRGLFKEAAEKYASALGILEGLVLR